MERFRQIVAATRQSSARPLIRRLRRHLLPQGEKGSQRAIGFPPLLAPRGTRRVNPAAAFGGREQGEEWGKPRRCLCGELPHARPLTCISGPMFVVSLFWSAWRRDHERKHD